MNKPISILLQEVKADTGWSQPRLAAELGISQPTVNRILRGQTECTGSTLRSIEALHQRTCIAAAASVNRAAQRRKTDRHTE